MNVDKFGRHHWMLRGGKKGDPGIGFKLTNTGDYNIENKRLTNVKSPVEPTDAATKQFLDAQLDDFVEVVSEMVLSNIKSYCQSNTLIFDEAGYNAKGKRIINVNYPENDNDVVVKKFLTSKLNDVSERIFKLENRVFQLERNHSETDDDVIYNMVHKKVINNN